MEQQYEWAVEVAMASGLHGRKPPKPKPDSDNCCPMVAAVRSVRRGRFRLARRYAGMSVRLIAARITCM